MVIPSRQYLDLVAQPQSELRRCMLRGTPPVAADLTGREYRGTNTAATSRLLGIRRFIKGFEHVEEDTVTGYNRHVRGGNLSTPWTASTWYGKTRFGYFTVTPVDPLAHDNRYLNALLLDYGSGLNPPRDPTALLRDYLVRTESGLLLGHAFLA
ncbi:MAG TPA: hypothetical protein VLA55_07570, partial [Ornithinibacter sp.]|nr:hypothetical protein [Ornithinibacter sp.]